MQQELYKNRNYSPDTNPSDTAFNYLLKVHPDLAKDFKPVVYQENSLLDLINKDPHLKYIYDPDSFVLEVGGERYPLQSQLLKNCREIIQIFEGFDVLIRVRKEVLEAESDYPQNNALFIQLLSGDCHVYGDEQRLKQKHVATLQVYKYVLEDCEDDGFYVYNITDFLKSYKKYLSKESPTNIFFTTTHLRDYHYIKQKNNAYYHIAAVNLPFQNVEFNYSEGLI